MKQSTLLMTIEPFGLLVCSGPTIWLIRLIEENNDCLVRLGREASVKPGGSSRSVKSTNEIVTTPGPLAWSGIIGRALSMLSMLMPPA